MPDPPGPPQTTRPIRPARPPTRRRHSSPPEHQRDTTGTAPRHHLGLTGDHAGTMGGPTEEGMDHQRDTTSSPTLPGHQRGGPTGPPAKTIRGPKDERMDHHRDTTGPPPDHHRNTTGDHPGTIIGPRERCSRLAVCVGGLLGCARPRHSAGAVVMHRCRRGGGLVGRRVMRAGVRSRSADRVW